MTTRIDRRQFLLLSTAAIAAGTAVPTPVRARQATPSPTLPTATATDDGIDVPVLEIGYASNGVTVSPEVPAGTVRILATMDGSEDFGTLTFRVPDGVDADEALAAVREVEAGVPDWLGEAYLPGGLRTDQRQPTTAEGFVVLEPGTYVVADFATASAASFVATGDAAAPVVIEPDIHVTALDSMTFTGLESSIPTGRHLWQLENGGELDHNIYFLGTVEGATAEDVLTFFQTMDSATPQPEVIIGGGWMSTSQMSPGASTWFYLDLPPGAYAALCSASDGFQGPPHFFMGMIVTFTVA